MMILALWVIAFSDVLAAFYIYRQYQNYLMRYKEDKEVRDANLAYMLQVTAEIKERRERMKTHTYTFHAHTGEPTAAPVLEL